MCTHVGPAHSAVCLFHEARNLGRADEAVDGEDQRAVAESREGGAGGEGGRVGEDGQREDAGF